MGLFLAVAVTWYLAVMPLVGEPQPSGDPIKTEENKDLFKPFDTGRTFESEEACKADGRSHLADYLRERGLPGGATGNISCSFR